MCVGCWEKEKYVFSCLVLKTVKQPEQVLERLILVIVSSGGGGVLFYYFNPL